jgi:hypothetical protein
MSGSRLVPILTSTSHPQVDGGRPNREGADVTWAAITAYRLGVAEPLAKNTLRTLFTCYSPGADLDAFERGISWATTAVYGSVALLRREKTGFAPSDYLVKYARARGRPACRSSPARC